MFRRVLFPTDFSAYARAVQACLPELQAAGMQEAVLLGIIHQDEGISGSTVDWNRVLRLTREAEAALDFARGELERLGLRVKTRVEVGVPAREIVRVAREEDVHLIFMGAQGKSMLQELLLGSTAAQVVRTAPVPVLIEKLKVVQAMGQTECRRVCARMFTRILVPTDFSPCAEAGLHVFKALKGVDVQDVILLHVQDERVMRHRSREQIAEFERTDQERLERIQKNLVLAGFPARAMLRHGIPFRETLQVAEEEDVCLIIVGSHGRSLVAEMLLGSTAENIVRHSQRAVLVVRREAQS